MSIQFDTPTRAPRLADPRPPQPPIPPVRLAQPKQHRVVAWRHDGGMVDTTHATKELAERHVTLLHWAIYWKAIIMCGRETVARHLIEEHVS